MNPLRIFLLSLSLLGLVGCQLGDDENNTCDIGKEGCPCTQGGACNAGLSCLSRVCVNAGGGMGGAGGAGGMSNMGAGGSGGTGGSAGTGGAAGTGGMAGAGGGGGTGGEGGAGGMSGGCPLRAADGAFVDPENCYMWSNGDTADAIRGERFLNGNEIDEYCGALNHAGFDDWRTPNIDELRTLVRGCPEIMPGGDCGFTLMCAEENPGEGSEACQSEACFSCDPGDGSPPEGACFWDDAQWGVDCTQAWSNTVAADGGPDNHPSERYHRFLIRFDRGMLIWKEAFRRNLPPFCIRSAGP